MFLLHAPARVNIDRAQPLVVVTYWHQFGVLMWLALFVAIAIASVGYLSVILRNRRTASSRAAPSGRGVSFRGFGFAQPWFDKLTMTPILCALSCLAALSFPVVFSSDVYAYAGYGWMALHGIDPYAHVRLTTHDPLMLAVIWQWANPPPISVYGPAFVLFAKIIVAMFGAFGPAAPLWAMRILACITLVLCGPLAYNAFGGFPDAKRVAAAAGIALNPIAIWSCAEGHNDVYILALGLAAYALIARGNAFTGALLAGLAPLVKIPGLIAAIIAAVALREKRTALRRIISGAIAGLVISGLIMWPMIASVRAHIVGEGRYLPQFSLQYMLSLISSHDVTVTLTAIIVAVLLITALAQARRNKAIAAIALAAALWIALPNPWPWYALWILPLAFIAWETPAAWALLALTLCSVARYLPDATVTPFGLLPSLAVTLVQLGLPLLVFIAGTTLLRQDRREIHRPVPDLELSHYS